jgi:hypothetical protein
MEWCWKKRYLGTLRLKFCNRLSNQSSYICTSAHILALIRHSDRAKARTASVYVAMYRIETRIRFTIPER